MADVLEFSKENIKKYIDEQIIFHRKWMDFHKSENYKTSPELTLMHADKSDCLQSMRIAFFGEVLK